MQKVIIFSHFKPTEEFDNFVKSLGYENPDYEYLNDMWFDETLIKYIEDNCNWHYYKHNDIPCIKGKDYYEFKIGFAGVASVIEVDTTKPWIIQKDNDCPYAVYPRLETDKFNHVRIAYGD